MRADQTDVPVLMDRATGTWYAVAPAARRTRRARLRAWLVQLAQGATVVLALAALPAFLVVLWFLTGGRLGQ